MITETVAFNDKKTCDAG